MRVLFFARHYAYLRLFESAIAELARRGHEVHLSADREEAEVLEKTEPLLAQRASGAEEVAFDDAVLLEDERRLGLHIGVVGRKVVGEKLAVLENGVDRIS